MYDTRLVNAAQEGDEAAFAALYDRNVDAVYDLCWALIGDEAETSRIVIDTFTLAARHLTDLTEASQLRPWLLAIARDRVLSEDEAGTLRSGWGSSSGPPIGPAPLPTAELRRWVREGAATSALADQVVVELDLRHNLDPAELAAAIGCEPGDVDRIVGQVADEVGSALSALVIARQDRGDCPGLAAAMAGWDGAPSVEAAELAEAHIATCERCTRRRAEVAPLELLAAALPVSPPPDLRTQVLDRVASELAAFRPRPSVTEGGPGRPHRVEDEGAAAGAGLVGVAGAGAGVAGAGVAAAGGGDGGGGGGRGRSEETGAPAESDPTVAISSYTPAAAGAAGVAGGAAGGAAGGGFGGPAGGGGGGFGGGFGGGPIGDDGGGNRPGWLPIVAVAAAVLVLILAIVLVFRSPGHTSVSTGATVTTAPTTTTTPTSSSPNTIVPFDTTTSAAPASQLQVDPGSLDFGSSDTNGQVTLSNTGQVPTSWRANAGASWLTIQPSGGQLSAGGEVTVVITVNRVKAPSGGFNADITFVPSDTGGQQTTLVINGSTPNTTTVPSTTSTTSTTLAGGGNGPLVSSVGASPNPIRAAPCATGSTLATVTADVSDNATLASVTIQYDLPGRSGSQVMSGSGGTYSATIGPSSTTGMGSYRVVAVDVNGATASRSGTITVVACGL